MKAIILAVLLICAGCHRYAVVRDASVTHTCKVGQFATYEKGKWVCKP